MFTRLFCEADAAYGYLPRTFHQRDTSFFDKHYNADDDDDFDDDTAHKYQDGIDDCDEDVSGKKNSLLKRRIKQSKKFITTSDNDLVKLKKFDYNIKRKKRDVVNAKNGRLNSDIDNDGQHISHYRLTNNAVDYMIPEINWQLEVEMLMDRHDDCSDSDSDSDNEGNTYLKPCHVIPKMADTRREDLQHISPIYYVQKLGHIDECFKIDNIDSRKYITDEHGKDPLDIIIPNPKEIVRFEQIDATNIRDTSKFVIMNNSTRNLANSSDLNSKVNQNLKHRPDMLSVKLLEKLKENVRFIRFDASNSNFNHNKRPRDDLTGLHRNKSNTSLISSLSHHIIAKRHKNTKCDLTEMELRNFHRPRMPKSKKIIPWQIHLRKINLIAKSSLVTTSNAVRNQADKLDLSAVSGDFICIEYIEERPPLCMNYGMVSAIFNFYRQIDQKDIDEKKQRLKLDSMHLEFSSGKVRIPRHLQLLIRERTVTRSFDVDTSAPRLEIGELMILPPNEKSPFLGDVKESATQQAILNNLFKAPLFEHRVNSTDFLLIRTKASNKILDFAIREIPKLFICGQTEPQKIVPKPSRSVTKIQEKMIQLAAARYLQTNFTGVEFGELQSNIYRFYKRKPGFLGTHLKRILKNVADEVDEGGKRWYPRDFSVGPNGEIRSSEEISFLERKYSSEELENEFTSEDVCAQESCNACEQALSDIHINDIDLQRVQLWLLRMTKWQEFKEERVVYVIQMMNDPHVLKVGKIKNLESIVKFLKKDIQRLAYKIQIAQHIFDRLVRAPWNTTESYVKSHIEKDGKGRMTLRGQGDPSGRGEAFAFVRLNNDNNSGNNKKAKNNTNRNDDCLIKLPKDQIINLLTKMGVSYTEAKSMKRWDRINKIRELSTNALKAGIGYELHKFAYKDGNANTVLNNIFNNESFRDKAQQIWDRQKESLCRTYIPFEDDDNDSDLDIEEELERTLQDAVNRSTAAINNIVRNAAEVAKAERKKVTLEEEKKEILGINTIISGITAHIPRIHARIFGESSDNIPVSISNDSNALKASKILPANYVKPRKVVKQIKKIINEDGEEVIFVKFIISDQEVSRVERENISERKTKLQRMNDLINNKGKKGIENVDDEEDLVLMLQPNDTGKLTLRLSQMTKAVNKVHLEKKMKEDLSYSLYGVQKQITSKGRAPSASKNYRLPHITLASKFENALMLVWRQKKSIDFRYPVSFEVKGYYDIIKNPISLFDIRKKIGDYQFLNSQALLADMDLLVQNCSSFNGPNSLLTQNAVAIYGMLQDHLQQDSKIFGRQKDPIAILEEEIKKKFAYLRMNKTNTSANINVQPILHSSSSSSSFIMPIIAHPINERNDVLFDDDLLMGIDDNEILP